MKKGYSKITAEVNGKKYTCKLTVKQPVTKVKLNKKSLNINVGGSYYLKTFISPYNANSKAVKWKSSNATVATVTAKGVIKGIKEGSATITATAKDGSKKSANCKVVIKQSAKPTIRVTGITLNKSSLYINTGISETLMATIMPSTASDKSLIWSSSNTAIATVTSTGTVKGIGEGMAIITATAKDGSNKSAECIVIIQQPPVEQPETPFIKVTEINLN